TEWSTATQRSLPVFSGTGTADVVACLDAHDDAGDFAVGTLSTENAYNDTDREFRFVKVDGAAPSLENTVAGHWDFFTENQIQRPPLTNPSNSLTLDQSELTSALTSILRNPALVGRAAVVHSHGLGGLLAIPDGGANIPSTEFDQATILANPVNS